MTFPSNAHTHSRWCDGADAIPAMVEAARTFGFVSLGFSGHARQGFDPAYSMAPDAQASYFAQLRALQAAPEPGFPRLWAGLEVDALAHEDLRRADYDEADYVIGSAHYLCESWQGMPVAVDGDPALLRRYVDEVYHGDGLAMASDYFDIEVQALLRDRPPIIGHFDLLRKYAAPLSLFDEADPAYRRLALCALERAFPCGGVLEINTGGMARGYLPTPYPTPELLWAWRELGGQITLTSDCHDRRYLAHAFPEAAALARQAGFRTVLRLGTGTELWEEEPL